MSSNKVERRQVRSTDSGFNELVIEGEQMPQPVRAASEEPRPFKRQMTFRTKKSIFRYLESNGFDPRKAPNWWLAEEEEEKPADPAEQSQESLPPVPPRTYKRAKSVPIEPVSSKVAPSELAPPSIRPKPTFLPPPQAKKLIILDTSKSDDKTEQEAK